MDADEVIARYGLRSHPQGDHFHEAFSARIVPNWDSVVSVNLYPRIGRGDRDLRLVKICLTIFPAQPLLYTFLLPF